MGDTKTADQASRPDFKRSAARALADERLGRVMDAATRRQDGGRRVIMPELGDPLAVCNLGAQIKNHTLQHLDRYLEQLADNVRQHGGHVYFAESAEQAREVIGRIAREANVKTIVKAKSMASEEVELNDDRLICDGPFVVARTAGIRLRMRRPAKSLWSSWLSGQPRTFCYEGTGKLLLCTVPYWRRRMEKERAAATARP